MKIAALTIAAMLAQTPSAPSLTETQARIEGVVIGPKGPLAGAEVTALWDPLPRTYQPEMVPRATTTSDGKFFMQVSPGAYRLTARAPGYVSQTYGAVRPGPDEASAGTVFRLNPQESLKDLTIVLTAEGILSGRVTTTNGQPLVRIQVAALKRKFTATGTALEARGVAQTNDRGEYRIPGLAAGTYILSASGLNPLTIAYETFVASRSNSAVPVTPSPGAYGPVYYPGADHSSRASTVEIQPGNEVRNIDFVLPKQSVYAIRGHVMDSSTGSRPSRVPAITIRPASSEYRTGLVSSGDAYKPDGTFELNGIPPGFHWVIAQLPGTPLNAEQRTLLATPGADISQLPRPSRGVALVHVTDGDVDSIELTIVRDLEVSGKLSIEGEPFDFSGKSGDFKLELRPTDSVGNGGPNSLLSLDADGEFVYGRLLPTEYRLTIPALPAPFYVKEARYGDRDVLTESIRLTRPSLDRLNIVLARGAEVRGTVTDVTARSLGNRKVVLIPDGMPHRSDLYKTAVTNAAGGFTIYGVAPGSYKAFAWHTLEEFQYFDEAFVSRFEDTGASVRVLGTNSVEIQVSLIR